jgi:hypothetical protein
VSTHHDSEEDRDYDDDGNTDDDLDCDYDDFSSSSVESY